MVNKTKFFIYGLFFISFYTSSQNTFVPDDNFELALIALGYDDAPLDDFVLTANISSITDLDLSPFVNKISNLTGIEDFTALTILNFENHLISSVNLNQNINLQQLFCNNNTLASLDVTNNTNLEILWCNNNLLASLNVTNSIGLRALDCSFNLLTSLDVTQNSSLVDFVCDNNQISILDVSNNTSLNRFQCGGNLLSILDISNNIGLSYLSCESNQIMSLNLSQNTSLHTFVCFENLLRELDLSQNTALTSLFCNDNDLCVLNIKNGNNHNIINVDFNNNTNLNCVVVDNPNANFINWEPASFSNYVSSQDLCNTFISVDEFDDVITFTNYVLPALIDGNYYTETSGNGLLLNAGDIISESQTIYVYNETICDSNESSFSVFVTDEYFIPKYFTPNNDGSHDSWEVLDNTNTFISIHIFNKYGKLLKSLPPNSVGWNGVFNGKLLNSDDYWYVINLNTGETIKGHFSLKR